MDGLDDRDDRDDRDDKLWAEDERWWDRVRTRWDGLPVETKKVIVRVGTGVGIFVCFALLRLLAGCDPLRMVSVASCS